ncbi:MAG: hypothetical protein DRJ42_31320 [Deltaproteobacteria bacterium]|nr:MAG: hypothetical protein DRJ42_31320 [Deltaproteobacteria bacterium]
MVRHDRRRDGRIAGDLGGAGGRRGRAGGGRGRRGAAGGASLIGRRRIARGPMQDGVDLLPADPRVAHLVALTADDHPPRGSAAALRVRVVLLGVDVGADQPARVEEPAAVGVLVLDGPAASAVGRARQRQVDGPVGRGAGVLPAPDPGAHAAVVAGDGCRKRRGGRHGQERENRACDECPLFHGAILTASSERDDNVPAVHWRRPELVAMLRAFFENLGAKRFRRDC